MQTFGPLVALDNPAFIHDSVEIFGKVHIGEGVSIWPRVVIRAENDENIIGPYSNLQDFVLVHIGYSGGTIIGAHCSITHHATVHGCTIGDNCLIGINATVMDNAVIGDNSIVAGHTIVPEGARIPANSIVAGVPGKVVKTRNNFVANRINAFAYHYNGLAYARGEHRAWDTDQFHQARDAEQVSLEAELAALEAL
ncbi:MAG: gamma carbonic anhydrase family protein [Alphaproteobacteria bacterium]|jgi:carbonic anhydrase/acetyltransferase-like protein (isoleucine patch superfamily)|nr:gamma carbonic anhydrase family protein [Alphaproteobacteria bacterium]